MARLFGKIDSDIRLGVGCRGHTKLSTKALFSHTGKNEDDGGVLVDAKWADDAVYMDVTAVHKGKSSVIATIKFAKDGTMSLVQGIPSKR